MSPYAYSSTASSDMSGVFVFLMILVGAVVLVAWLTAIKMFIGLAREKDPGFYRTGLLWFIGIFATPLATGLYVCAMADRRNTSAPDGNQNNADALNKELPFI